MKKMMFSMMVLSSISAQAFDPNLSIAKGQADYAASLRNFEESRLVIRDTKNAVLEKSKEMSLLRSKNDEINKFYKDCSIVMKKGAAELEDRLLQNVIIDYRDYGKTYLDNIKKNVKGFLAMKNCSDCAPEIKEEVMERHIKDVEQNLYWIQAIKNEFSIFDRKDLEIQVERYLKTERRCRLDRFFKMKYKETEGQFLEPLPLTSILSEKYVETLEYIANNSPITVKMTEGQLGSTRSKYNKRTKTVSMHWNIDIGIGTRSTTPPDIEIPVLIIARELNLN
jgi:hypothetical protein